MKRFLLLGLFAATTPLGFSSCAKETERKVVGPTSDASQIPWNRPEAGQGGGQFGALMNQSRYRR